MKSFSQFALTLAWIVGIVYATIPAFWLLLHPFANYWRGRKAKAYPVLVLMWMVIWIVAGWLTFPYRFNRLWSTQWSWLAWAAFIGFGISIYRRVGRGFGRANVLGQAEVQPGKYEQRLVTTGLHARVRHPIYLAHWAMLTAWTLGAATVALFALWCWAVVTGAVMIWFEDRELEQRFGHVYREYKRQVPAVIPRLEPRRHGDRE